jgi:hypothetical protein
MEVLMNTARVAYCLVKVERIIDSCVTLEQLKIARNVLNNAQRLKQCRYIYNADLLYARGPLRSEWDRLDRKLADRMIEAVGEDYGQT